MGDDPNVSEPIVLAQYPDFVHRETYPPLPRRRGNPNARLDAGGEADVLSALADYQRKKGIEPISLQPPAPSALVLPADPAVDAMRAAGWL